MSHSPSSAGRPEPREPHLLPWLEYGWNRAQSALVLGLVPVVATLLDFGRVARALSTGGGTDLGIAFRFPAPIADLWTFTQMSLGGGVGGVTTVSLVGVLVAVVFEGILAAGYLGSIDDMLAGRPVDFAGNVERYAGRLILYNALWLLVTVGIALVLGSISPVLVVIVGLPAILLATYLLYATPYLLVVGDASLEVAIDRSITYATRGGPYMRYGLGYLAGVGGVSVVSTAVVANFGPLGLLLGVAAAATFGFALNVATMGMIRALEAGRFRGRRSIDPHTP